MAIALLLGVSALSAGCARHEIVLDMQGTVLYEKPRITAISHKVDDQRRQGGTVVVSVELRGDTGLEGSFDITPGVADHEPLSETADGFYVGKFSLNRETVGGPFSIVGRLRHVDAGEIVMRDTQQLMISLTD